MVYLPVRISLDDAVFIQAASVDEWDDSPQLLDKLTLMADDTPFQLKVILSSVIRSVSFQWGNYF